MAPWPSDPSPSAWPFPQAPFVPGISIHRTRNCQPIHWAASMELGGATKKVVGGQHATGSVGRWQAAGESKICGGTRLLVLGGWQANSSDAQLLVVQWDGRQTARSHSHQTSVAEAKGVARGIKMGGPCLVPPLLCPSACSLPIWCSLRCRGNGGRGVKILRH